MVNNYTAYHRRSNVGAWGGGLSPQFYIVNLITLQLSISLYFMYIMLTLYKLINLVVSIVFIGM